MIKAALAHGEIPKKIKAIPISMLIRDLKSLPASLIPTENIIIGILNKRTIIPPIEKFALFSKFIDADIELKQDKINDPIIKVNIKLYTSLNGRLKKRLATGIDIRKGTWTNKKWDNIFKKTSNS